MVAIVVLVCVFFFLSIEMVGLLLKKRGGEVVEKASVKPFVDIQLPRGLFVGEGHSWAKLTESGELKLGADEFLAQAIGGADRVELPDVGTRVSKGQPLATLWRSGRKVEVNSPVNGTVVTTNHEVEQSPMAFGDDPYGTGWLATVWPVEHTEAIKSLRVGDKAVKWLEDEVQRFVEFLAGKTSPELVGATLPDGARPVIGAALVLDQDGLDEFQREFTQDISA